MNDPGEAVKDGISEAETPSAGDITAAAQAVEQAFRDKVAIHERPWPEASYEWIVPYAETFCEPDPKEPQTASTELEAIRDNLKSGQVTAVSGLGPKIEDWEGEAADSFYDHFLVPFPQAVDNQVGIAEELRTALQCYESLLRSGRHDIKLILDKTKGVVDGYDGDKTASAQFGLSIVIALTAILTAGPTGGLSLTMNLNLATVAGSAAIATNAVITADQTIGGDTLGEIMEAMMKAMTDVRKEMDHKEKLLGEALGKTHDEVNAILNTDNQTTLQKLLPNEGTGSGGRTVYEGGMELTPGNGPYSGNDDQPDVIDGEDNDTPEFRPPA